MRPDSDRVFYDGVMADVTERMLRLLATLQSGQALGGDELSARLGVSPRTLRRDVERLRGYGYPVSAQPGPGGHYRLAAGQRVPPLVLDDEEAIAAVIGLATLAASASMRAGTLGDAASRAYGKVDALLPARLRPRAASLRTSVEAERYVAPGVHAAALGDIADAVAARRVIGFTYVDARERTSARRVEPHRQVYIGLRWYLLGWDLDREDWRIFRTDRISDLRVTETRYAPRPLPADSAVAYLRSGLGETFDTVRVTVDAPIDAVADALRHEDARLRAVGATCTEAALSLDSWQRLLPALSRLGTSFRIEAPSDMAADITQFAHRLAAAVQTHD